MAPTHDTPATPGTSPEMPWTRSGEPGRWTRAVVYGLGLSGRAAAQWLLARGIDVVAFDQRDADRVADDPSFGELRAALEGVETGEAGSLRLELGRDPQELPDDLAWGDVDALVLSPGVPADRPLVSAARAAGVPVLAEVELAFPFLRGTVVGITGSNGKSTTTALAAAMLDAGRGADDPEVVACGNFGRPVISLADDGVERIYVMELSSFQLESVDLLRPRAAAFLNLAADHLDRYDSLDDYRRAKLQIFRRQTAEDVAILHADDPGVAAVAGELRARCRFFSRRGPVDDGCWLEAGSEDGGRVLEAGPGLDAPQILFRTADVPLPGVHQLENAMAAALLARAAGASPEQIVRGLRAFRGLPHRLETVAEHGGVTYFDDSKGTNPAAVVKSLEGFDDGSVHLILGGRFKGGDLGELAAMASRKVARAYLIGESAQRFAEALRPHGVEHEIAGTLDVAVRRSAREAAKEAAKEAAEDAAQETTAAGTTARVVVLSPACSSFDQFPNFVARGQAFQRLVRELTTGSLAKGDRDGA